MFSNGRVFICFVIFLKFAISELTVKSAYSPNASSNNAGIMTDSNFTDKSPFMVNSSIVKSGRIESLPQPEALFGIQQQKQKQHPHQHQRGRNPDPTSTVDSDNGPLPVFPERSDAVYFIVAVIGGAKVWGRTLAKTLMDMGPPFGSPLGPILRPLYVDLPPSGKFSVKVLSSLCKQTDGMPVAGIVVAGDGQSARAVAMAGHAMRIPVLWAKGGTANIHSPQHEAEADLQSMLQPATREILEAIRALFLQAHWHSFFVLSDVDATMVLSSAEGRRLKTLPLRPTILPLKPGADSDIFRQLAHISRSTRGIVLLLCKLASARKIMSEAKRLNMAGGHFIWLWADTSSTAEFFDVNRMPNGVDEPILETPEGTAAPYRRFENSIERKIDYDTLLLSSSAEERLGVGSKAKFNPYVPHSRGAKTGARFEPRLGEDASEEAGKSKRDSDPFLYSDEMITDNNTDTARNHIKPKRKSIFYGKNLTTSHVLFHHFKDFPVGLLALKPIKMSVDHNFIKAAIRLFASTWAQVANDEQIEEERHRLASANAEHYDDYANWLKMHPSRDEKRKRRRRRRNINKVNKISLNLNSSSSDSVQFHTSSDITNSTLFSGQNNQNLSGLINQTILSNTASNIISNRTKPADGASVKSKRANTWWSKVSSASTQQQKQFDGGGSGERYRKMASYYKGGCFGSPSRLDAKRAKIFAGALRQAASDAHAAQPMYDGSHEKSLIARFEILNLVPDENNNSEKLFEDDILIRRRGPRKEEHQFTKWRRVGLISGRNVQLDTIVWPGGDIVVSGLSAKSRTVFRIVTALAPPFVMESDLDEDGLCLRGLPCHRLKPSAEHNLTLMFNAIETRDRLKEDAAEHGIQNSPDFSSGYDHTQYSTKCCYGLSMDLLDSIATELEFEFHLYIVYDELFGSKFSTLNDFLPAARTKQAKRRKSSSPTGAHNEDDGSEQSQRKYHSPEGRTRNFRSASFERSTEDEQLPLRDWPDANLNFYDNEDDYAEISSKLKEKRNTKKKQWNGIIGDLISGSADMSFAPLTVSRSRAEVIDFSVPYFHSGVSLLAAPQSKTEIPLLAFLLPFSTELWIAIFTSLNVTAIAVAIYEWLSPFGLNPWGRQRNKNFSMSSALWVMWGLLCGHLVAFKAPKSWPNKFLINVWGGFSVIFIASYTANIAALIAGLFFHHAANNPEISLLKQRVGAPTSSAAESYMKLHRSREWDHIKKYSIRNLEEGIIGLKNGTLDLLLGDTPILDYYRAIDLGCNLLRIGETYVEDTYAVGMKKDFPLKESISALITKYSSNGYMDILADKWYGGLPCYKYDTNLVMPRPLGVAAVAGVFILLGLGMFLGLVILIFEHWFYKYMLPKLRHKPKGTVWRSRNIMFFSQKLYRFINCVELVSPHHAARELVHTLRQGQIASLFQKSIKRKEDEQRRRRKSKAQFFEMIQEIRRVQQIERQNAKLEAVAEAGEHSEFAMQIPEIITPHSRSPKPKSSPRPKLFSSKHKRSKSNSSSLSSRRFSTDSILSERMDTIGRRLSRDLTNSPPDLGRRFGDSNSKFDTFSGKNVSTESIEETKFDTFCAKDTNRLSVPTTKKHLAKRTPLNAETFSLNSKSDDQFSSSRSEDSINRSPLPVLKEGLTQTDSMQSVVEDQRHEELVTKYGESDYATIPMRQPAPSGVQAIAVQRSSLRSQTRSPYQLKRIRQGSLDVEMEARPKLPTPSPTRSTRTNKSDSPLVSTSPSQSNLQKVSLERLSREDLLKLSESSQTEIHEYLSKTATDYAPEPP